MSVARGREQGHAPRLKKGHIMLKVAAIGLQGIFRRPALGAHHFQKPVHMPVRCRRLCDAYLCRSFSWGKRLHDLRLLRREIRQPPHGAIDSAASMRITNRNRRLSGKRKSPNHSAVYPRCQSNDYPIKSLGALALAVLKAPPASRNGTNGAAFSLKGD